MSCATDNIHVSSKVVKLNAPNIRELWLDISPVKSRVLDNVRIRATWIGFFQNTTLFEDLIILLRTDFVLNSETQSNNEKMIEK